MTTLERHPARALGLNDIGRVTLTAARPLLFDAYADNRATGAFILIDRITNGTYGAGMILAPAAGEAASEGARRVSLAERARRLGHQAAVVVVASEELAYALERRLWDEGLGVHVLAAAEVGALGVSQALGMISIVVGGVTEAPADAVIAGDGASVESVLKELRARGVMS